MNLSDITYDSALHVARNMREWDRKEIYATRWNESAEELASDVSAYGRFGWIAGTTEPIAAVGAVPSWPGVWSVFMFATNDFRQIRFSLTSFVRRVIIPSLRDAGAHRAECASHIGHEEAHRWLELLGAHREGEPMREYGKDGSDFVRYVWRRSDTVDPQV